MKLSAAITTVAVVAVGTLTAAPAFADRIDRREAKQQHRIFKGVLNGKLTGREFWRMQKRQARIRRMERRAERDGHVSWRERSRIRRAQNRADWSIYRQKHDGQKAWWR